MAHPSADVIVVGAGPAGTSTAYQLARAGLSVLLLDRHDFPRVKACAGGLTQKTLQILPFSVEPVIRRRFSSLEIGNGHGRSKVFSARDIVCAMTVRSEFDHYCLKEALKAGASFLKVASISSIQVLPDKVNVTSSEGTLSCKYLVGADGANSSVRRLTGLFKEIKKGFAMEACVRVSDVDSYPMKFDFFAVERGYGWIFPKHDHLNIGLYTYDAGVRLTKEMLNEYIAQTTRQSEFEGFTSHHLGLGGARYEVGDGRVFLVGDAAGLVDPVLGEGIYYAVRSGQLVAHAISTSGDEPNKAASMYNELLGELRNDVKICAWAAKNFFQFQQLGYLALTLPTTRHFLMKGFEKGMSLAEVTKNALLLPFMGRGKVFRRNFAEERRISNSKKP